MRSIVRPLDRYVFVEFWKIFVSTALGFPLLLVVIDLTDNLNKYLSRNLPRKNIIMSYVYWLPDSMFMVLPAAVLFATVFSIGGLTRHAPRRRASVSIASLPPSSSARSSPAVSISRSGKSFRSRTSAARISSRRSRRR